MDEGRGGRGSMGSRGTTNNNELEKLFEVVYNNNKDYNKEFNTIKNFDLLYEFIKDKCDNSLHSGTAIYFCIADNCNSKYLCSECVIENSAHFNSHKKYFVPLDDRIKFLKFVDLLKFETILLKKSSSAACNSASANNLNDNLNNNNPISPSFSSFSSPKLPDKINEKIKDNFKTFYTNLKKYIIYIIDEDMNKKLQHDISYFEEIIKVVYNDKKFKKEVKDFNNFMNKINVDIENYIKFKPKFEFNNFYSKLSNSILKEGDVVLNKLNIVDSSDNPNSYSEVPYINEIRINTDNVKKRILRIIDESILANLEPQVNKGDKGCNNSKGFDFGSLPNFVNVKNLNNFENLEAEKINKEADKNIEEEQQIQEDKVIEEKEEKLIEAKEEKISEIKEEKISEIKENQIAEIKEEQIIKENNLVKEVEEEIILKVDREDQHNKENKEEVITLATSNQNGMIENLFSKDDILALTNKYANENGEIVKRSSSIKIKLDQLKQRFSVIKK